MILWWVMGPVIPQCGFCCILVSSVEWCVVSPGMCGSVLVSYSPVCVHVSFLVWCDVASWSTQKNVQSAVLSSYSPVVSQVMYPAVLLLWCNVFWCVLKILWCTVMYPSTFLDWFQYIPCPVPLQSSLFCIFGLYLYMCTLLRPKTSHMQHTLSRVCTVQYWPPIYLPKLVSEIHLCSVPVWDGNHVVRYS